MTLMTEVVTLRSTVPSGGYDDFGNALPGATTETASPAWYEPLSSREASDRQIQQTYGYVVFLPLAADIDGADAIVIEGVEYAAIGEPQRFPAGFIVEGYQRVIVERTTG